MSYANQMSADTRQSTHADARLAELVAASVTRLARRLRRERRTDLTATQLSVLGTIRQHGPMAMGTLAAYERVRPPSITRTVHYLAELGLLRREAHPSDRRQVVLHLSVDGEELLAAERQRRDAWLAQRLRELDPADKELVRRAVGVLERLAHA